MATNIAALKFTADTTTTGATFADRFARVVNVKDYGAVGDGIADDTSECQAAMDAAWTAAGSGDPNTNKCLYFPAGTYNISSTLAAPVALTGCRMLGDGPYASVLQWTGSKAGGVFHSLVYLDGWRYGSIENLAFVMNGHALTDKTIAFDWDWDTSSTGSSTCEWSNCRFENATYGWYAGRNGSSHGNNDASMLLNCIFKDCENAIVPGHQNCIECGVYGCYFEGMAASAASLGTGTGNLAAWVGNKFVSNNTDIITDADGITIAGCLMSSDILSDFGTHATHVIGCVDPRTSAANWIHGQSRMSIDGCYTTQGLLTGTGQYTVRNTSFGTNLFNGATSSQVIEWILPRGAFSTLPTGTNRKAGMTATVTDSTTNTFGATVAGSGGNTVVARFNGSNWTVCEK